MGVVLNCEVLTGPNFAVNASVGRMANAYRVYTIMWQRPNGLGDLRVRFHKDKLEFGHLKISKRSKSDRRL